jgi:antirestriction protein ArdC
MYKKVKGEKKGEKATWIVYASKVKKEDENGVEHECSFLKWYYVFNLEQTEGIPIEAPPVKPIEEVEAFIEGCRESRHDRVGARAPDRRACPLSPRSRS